MDPKLVVAALILVLVAAAHSYLGERYIVRRLFRRPLPPLYGDDKFTRRTIRYAWHVTSVLALGLATVLLAVATSSRTLGGLGPARPVALSLVACVVLAWMFTRARHLSWVAFAVAAALAW